MLVLSRKLDERVVINGAVQVEVVVLAFKGGKVRLGFIADDDVAIHRKEIFDVLSDQGKKFKEPKPFESES